MSSAAAPHVRYVDGLRAVAVLAVIACHTSKIALAGRHGVELFFVISGFCLSYPVLYALRSDGLVEFDVVKYALRRVLRIVPPYWCAIAALWLTFPLFRVNAADIVKQALFIDGNVHWLNQSFWSLAVEFRWYFLFPVLLWLWVHSARTFWFIAMACIAAEFTKAGSLDLEVLPAFMLGIAACDMRVNKARITPWLVPLGAMCVVLALRSSWDLPWEVLAFVFVSCAGAFRPLERFLSIRPLTVVGTASYSIYLVHLPIVYYLRADNEWLAAAAAVASGGAFWTFFERPFVAGTLRSALVRELRSVPGILAAVGIPARVILRSRRRMPPLQVIPDEPIRSYAHHGAF